MQPTRHFLLRDRRRWHGKLAGLAVDRDGVLTLASMPAPVDGRRIQITTALPTVREVSGIAAGPNEAVFVSDTTNHRVLFVDGACAARVWLPLHGGAGSAPGQFSSPRGLALNADALLVADEGNSRVQHLALPALEAHLAWSAWARPVAVAVDRKGRVIVADATSNRVERCDEHGTPDGAFNAALLGAAVLQQPRWIAVGADDRLLVSDIAANQVFVFDESGALLDQLDGPPGWLPGAVAADEQRAYVADAASASVLTFDADGTLIGDVPHWYGPVTALAIRSSGDLLIKPTLDARFHEFKAQRAYVRQGTLEAGPLDAGVDTDWERVWCEASQPAGTGCLVEYADQASKTPAPVTWHTVETHDALLATTMAPLPPEAPLPPPGTRRFLWLRIRLTSSSAMNTPRLMQARAATEAENYLDYLPLTYRLNDQRADRQEGFLSRYLKLLRGEFAIVEEALDLMPRTADPLHADATDLAWLADWLAIELPQIRTDDERRALIARAVQLFARRGTPWSIAEFVELHTGIRPTIVEAFEGRAVWMLGVSSRLDFDTRLPPLDPLGWVVADPAAAQDCCEATAPEQTAACGCTSAAAAAEPRTLPATTIGRAIVGEGGPLAAHQIGMPLFADEAYRFCVLVDAYRICGSSMLDEVHRIVEREKPAHTDYRLQLIAPDLRIGMQSRLGVDAIVGGEPPGWRFAAELGTNTRLAPRDAATRLDEIVLGEGLTLN
jgi:phage tail-like protein